MGDDVRDAAAADDGDAVPPPLAVVGQLVTGVAERSGGGVSVFELRLLQEQDVRLRAIEPPEDLLEARLQRVDVPGGDAHLSDGPTRKPHAARGDEVLS